MASDAKTPAPPSRRGRWVVLVLAVLTAPLFAELMIRFMLFGDSDLARRMGAGIRDASLFADPNFEDSYWRLRLRLGISTDREDPPLPHPELGWISSLIHPETLAHRKERRLDGRRPVLLYGASFASRKYAMMLDKSEVGEEYRMLVYGVGGYGVDQVYLLLRETLPRFAEQDPVVVLGLKSDGDFERANLSARPWPKPRFEVRDGELHQVVTQVPTPEEYAGEPIGIRSYLWSHLVSAPGLLPESVRRTLGGFEASRQRSRDLITALVRAIKAETDAHGVQCVYLLFVSPATLREQGLGEERERFLRDLLDAEGVPYVLARPALQEALATYDESLKDYFHDEAHIMENHPTDLGMQRMMPTLLRAIRGEGDGAAGGAPR